MSANGTAARHLFEPPVGGWFRVPNAVVDRLAEIGLAPFAVYCVIVKHADRQGVAWPAVGTIAKTCGITRATAYRAVRTLKAAGLVKTERKRDEKGRDVPTRYTLTPVGESVTTALPVGSVCDREGVICDIGEGVTTVPRTRPKENKTQVNKNPLPPALDTAKFRKAWEEWQQHRKEIKKALTPSTRAKQLAQLAGYGVEVAIQSIAQSITAGWTGLFEPKENGRNGRPKQLSIGPGQRHVGAGDGYGQEGVF